MADRDKRFGLMKKKGPYHCLQCGQTFSEKVNRFWDNEPEMGLGGPLCLDCAVARGYVEGQERPIGQYATPTQVSAPAPVPQGSNGNASCNCVDKFDEIRRQHESFGKEFQNHNARFNLIEAKVKRILEAAGLPTTEPRPMPAARTPEEVMAMLDPKA